MPNEISPTVRGSSQRRSGGKPKSESDLAGQIWLVAFACVIIGLLGSLLYVAQAGSLGQFISIAGVALAVAGAALLAGGLLGFLFGIPRKLQRDSVIPSTQQTDSDEMASRESIGYQANTNLEQISDWLTKILVGVGLTQLTTFPEALQKYATYTAPGFGNFANSEVFAIAQLMYFLLCGFFVSYLWTRLNLAGALYQADLEATLGGKIARVEDTVSGLQQQIGRDSVALKAVQWQLHPSLDSAPATQEQLNDAIKLASASARDQIFQQVSRVVDQFNNGNDTVTNMEKTIPILEALAASDSQKSHHEYHGYLGLALSSQRHPKYKEAEAELTKAIEIRGNWEDFGEVGWEFNRALCRIVQDDDFLQDRKSSAEFKERVLADLRVAESNPEIGKFTELNLKVSKWLKLNNEQK